ncbi:MAG: hypothetical protein SGJ13_09360 [Actinomycetota bacterium]|nr:hypothetical protein [Actinomycetota bacterium]
MVNAFATVAEAAKEAMDVKEAALEAITDAVSDVRDRVHELHILERPKKKRRGKGLLFVVLVAVGCAALAYYLKQKREEEEYAPAPDAFGAAVEESSRAAAR